MRISYSKHAAAAAAELPAADSRLLRDATALQKEISFILPSSSHGARGEVAAVGDTHKARALSGETQSDLYYFEPVGRVTQLGGGRGGAALGQGRGPPTVPTDKSSSLWDFPDIKKWQVIHSRTNFWPEMEKMNAEHMYESQPFR